MGSCGGGNDSQNTSFRRAGTTSTSRFRHPPAWLMTAMKNNLTSSSVSEGLGQNEDAFLSSLMTKDYTQPPGKVNLDGVMAQSPTDFTGSQALGSIAGTDPMSSVYSEQLSAFYKNLFDEAAAAGASGPDAVRGGAHHGAMVRGQVLEKAALDKFKTITDLQLQQQDRTMAASQIANAVEAQRRSGITGAQNQLATQWIEGLRTGARGGELLNMKRRVGSDAITGLSDLIAPTTSTTLDNVAGSGNQESSHFGWNAGLNCCFIFLEALNGELPWYVRKGRDMFCSVERVRGYKKMASWLVPLMQKSRVVKHLVNLVMVKPFLVRGAWFYNDTARKPVGRFLEPICEAWFKIWDLTGKK